MQKRKFSGILIALLVFTAGFGRTPRGNERPQGRPGSTSTGVPSSGLLFASDVISGVVWPSISWPEFIAGLQSPMSITHAGDRSGRIFVTEQIGRVRIVRNNVLETRPFLDISSRVKSGGEQGLLCTVFPPAFAARKYIYVNYTRVPDGATVVSRFRLTNDPDLADASSEEVILVVPQPFANHNGGQMAFGPRDGYLYIGLGDGGSGGDPFNNAQNFGSFLGKLLRIDTESGPSPYAVPPRNPYVGTPGRLPEIWALGLRNPWRFSFDRETQDLIIADVGQSLREEIDVQDSASSGGENYGWRLWEGTLPYNPPSGGEPPPNYVPPVFEYDHTQGCAIIGGYVYRGLLYPQLRGIYFFGDFCSGRIWGLRRIRGHWVSRVLAETGLLITTFGEDEAGNIYMADIGGKIYVLSAERVKKGVIR
jgi:glucose/arabinose dehydrogenase